jgi:hypothetical protein
MSSTLGAWQPSFPASTELVPGAAIWSTVDGVRLVSLNAAAGQWVFELRRAARGAAVDDPPPFHNPGCGRDNRLVLAVDQYQRALAAHHLVMTSTGATPVGGVQGGVGDQQDPLARGECGNAHESRHQR